MNDGWKRAAWIVLSVLPGAVFALLAVIQVQAVALLGGDTQRALGVGALWGAALLGVAAAVAVIAFAVKSRGPTRMAAAFTAAGAMLLLLVEALRYATGL